MTKSVLYVAIGLVATSSMACAEDLSTARAPLSPGTFTTSAHSDEWKIENAVSAGPASITDNATVVDWPLNLKDGHTHGRVLRQGTNGWTCMPDIPGRPQHDPMCADEYPFWSRSEFGPFPVISKERICHYDEFSRDRCNGHFAGFSCTNKLIVFCLKTGIASRCDQSWHVDGPP
jgi:hypothetical protein